MAPGLRHWIAVAVLGCALVALAKLPPREPAARPSGRAFRLPEQMAQRRLWRHLARANENLLLLERRDSLLPLLHQSLAIDDTRPAVLVDRRLPPAVRRAAVSVIEPSWRQLAGDNPAVRVAVAIVPDTAASYRNLPRGDRYSVRLVHLLPEVTDGRTCLVVVALGTWSLRRMAQGGPITPRTLGIGYRRQRARLLGPCAFYAAFGSPGPRVKRWLEDVDYRLARYPDWPETQPLSQWVANREDWSRWWDPRWVRSYFDFSLVACARGNRERCSTAAQSPYVDRSAYDWGDRDLAPSSIPGIARSSGMRPFARHPLGPRAAHYLADMVADLGRDRFTRFWTSDAPVDVAFDQAVGITIDEWTMRWARAQIGLPESSPRVPVASAVLTLLLAGAFVGGGAVWVTRRQVW